MYTIADIIKEQPIEVQRWNGWEKIAVIGYVLSSLLRSKLLATLFTISSTNNWFRNDVKVFHEN